MMKLFKVLVVIQIVEEGLLIEEPSALSSLNLADNENPGEILNALPKFARQMNEAMNNHRLKDEITLKESFEVAADSLPELAAILQRFHDAGQTLAAPK